MAMTTSMLLVVLPIALLVYLLPVALVILLQVWLCKKGKWLGLILPGLTLALSLLLVFSMTVLPHAGNLRVEVNGEVVQEEVYRPSAEDILAALPRAGAVFLVANIPTAVLGGIWLHYKNRRDWQENLKKMHIQDLE